jgi:signal recognition particle subunit SRP72
MHRNQLALDLQLGKYNGVAEATLKSINEATDKRTSPEILTAGIFNAAAHACAVPAKTALMQVLPLLERRPYDVGLILVIVQLYVLTDNVTTATAFLEAFLAHLELETSSSDQSARYTPGLVAVLVSLYAQQDRTSSIKTELSKAAAYWRDKPDGVHPPTSFLISAGLALLDQPAEADLKLARSLFQSVHAQNADSVSAAAGVAASTTDPNSLPDGIESRLPTIGKLTTGIDVLALEGAGIARLPVPVTSISNKRDAPMEASNVAPLKKHRQGKLPKDYDDNKKPDPERWLPLRDRSNFRPRGKKGKGRAQGGERGGMTQGGVVSEESSRPSTPAQSVGVVQSKKAAGAKKGPRKR